MYKGRQEKEDVDVVGGKSNQISILRDVGFALQVRSIAIPTTLIILKVENNKKNIMLFETYKIPLNLLKARPGSYLKCI